MLIEFHGDHKTHKVEVNLATLIFGYVTGFKIVVSVCVILMSLAMRITFRLLLVFVRS